MICACTESDNCSQNSLRLADGKIDQEGRLEVCANGVWGSVCDSGFDAVSDGHVICSELGYQSMYTIVLISLYIHYCRCYCVLWFNIW